MNTNDIPDPTWYADTEATARMTSYPGNLLSCSSYNGSNSFFVNDGTEWSISYVGDTVSPSSPSEIHLQNVFVVPVKKNLLSVSQLSKDDSSFF